MRTLNNRLGFNASVLAAAMLALAVTLPAQGTPPGIEIVKYDVQPDPNPNVVASEILVTIKNIHPDKTMADFHMTTVGDPQGDAQPVAAGNPGNPLNNSTGNWGGTESTTEATTEVPVPNAPQGTNTTGIRVKGYHWKLEDRQKIGGRFVHGLLPGQQMVFRIRVDGKTPEQITDPRVSGFVGQKVLAMIPTTDANDSNSVTRFNKLGGFISRRNVGGDIKDSTGKVVRIASLPGARLIPETLEIPAGSGTLLELETVSGAGLPYIMAVSFSAFSGIPLPDGRTIPLDPDDLFFLSLQTNPFLLGFQGTVGFGGVANAFLEIPLGLPATQVVLAAVTLDPASGTVAEISNMLSLTVGGPIPAPQLPTTGAPGTGLTTPVGVNVGVGAPSLPRNL